MRGRWSRLFADNEQELRDFARFIGLQAAWIQHPGTGHVHFDVTGSQCDLAISYGAQPVTRRAAGEMLAAREAASCASRPPEHPCSDCGTADLTHGREVCQACGLLQTLAAREAQPSDRPLSPQIDAGP